MFCFAFFFVSQYFPSLRRFFASHQKNDIYHAHRTTNSQMKKERKKTHNKQNNLHKSELQMIGATAAAATLKWKSITTKKQKT